LLALFSLTATPVTALAGTASAPPRSSSVEEYQHVDAGNDGSLTLRANAPPAPAIYGTFRHFGIAIPLKQLFTNPFQRIQITYAAETPAGSAVRIDLRASVDGVHWSAWEIDLASGIHATFTKPMFFAQYRATLLSNGRRQPFVRALRLVPERGKAIYTTMSDDQPIAPTWKLRATREGLVGRHTANGHKIKPHDHFVSLPSWRALSPDGTTDYQVRITYNGRSSVAPVYDVGPWNVHDNYWDEQREKFADLPRGWPEDHAAYFDNYNGGRAEKGRVRFPTAVDIGDGVWWDDLGIKGDQATVEITFLWLGRDPLQPPPAEAAPPTAPPPAQAAPPPPPPAQAAPPTAPPPAQAAPPPPPPPAQAAPPPPPPAQAAPPPSAPPPAEAPQSPDPPPAEAAPPTPPPLAQAAPPPPAPPPAPIGETLVDDGMPTFHGQAAITWYHAPGTCGTNETALWTYTTPNPTESENVGRWQPNLPGEAMYDVYVAIPACKVKKPNTNSAHYLVQHRDGTAEITIDQAAMAGTWVLLGRFPFRAGDGGFVELRDVAGDAMRALWFDAVKWVPAQ